MRRLLSNPTIVGLAVVLLLASRWIWVAGLSDYGWTYEVAARLLRGQVYYKDFPLVHAPLGSYTLAGMMYLLGDHLFVSHLHLWLSYLISIFAGLLVLRAIGASRGAQLAGIALAAVIACPAFGIGHAFNYQAPALVAAVILCVLEADQDRPRLWSSAAALTAVFCIYTKQNVGLAIAIVTPVLLPRKGRGPFLAVLVGAFLLIFSYFAWNAGAEESWRELFTDAASNKGGLLTVAARGVPRLIFRPGLPGRRWLELAATAAAYLCLIPLAVRLSRPSCQGAEQERLLDRTGAVAIIAVGAAVLLSLVNIKATIPRDPIIHPWTLLLELVYMLLCFLALAHCIRGLDHRWMVAVALVLVFTIAQEASNPNFSYSVSLAAPILCGLLSRGSVALRPAWVGVSAAIVYLVGTTVVGPVYLYGLCTYQPTYPLPDHSPFHGLRAPAFYAQVTSELWQDVRPLLGHQRTLWLVPGGGPYLAFGGSPTYSAPFYASDSLPARLERRFIAAWQEDPPDVVILNENFQASSRSHLLEAGYIKSHVLGGYKLVWRSKVDPQLGVWMNVRGAGVQGATLRSNGGLP